MAELAEILKKLEFFYSRFCGNVFLLPGHKFLTLFDYIPEQEPEGKEIRS
jgi:hypothetical protein